MGFRYLHELIHVHGLKRLSKPLQHATHNHLTVVVALYDGDANGLDAVVGEGQHIFDDLRGFVYYTEVVDVMEEDINDLVILLGYDRTTNGISGVQ
jgi:hypothetical protein